MPMTPESKIICTVLIQHRSPEEFTKAEKAIEDRAFKNYGAGAKDPNSKRRLEVGTDHHVLSSTVSMVGFAEVYWDRGTRIMVDYYFRGDQRTRYGDRIQSRSSGPVSGDRFYAYSPMTAIGRIHLAEDTDTKRRAIVRALDHIEETARDVLCFVDTSPERAIVQALDVNAFFT